MNEENFMNQKANEMTVKELIKATSIKVDEVLKQPIFDFKVGDTVELIEEKRDMAHWYGGEWTPTYCFDNPEKIKGIGKDGRLSFFDNSGDYYYNPACFKKIEKITSLKDLAKGTFIEFNDKSVCIVVLDENIEECATNEKKALCVVKYYNLKTIWISSYYLRIFKEGNYKRIFKGKIKIEEQK